jgi:hypothetical protein
MRNIASNGAYPCETVPGFPDKKMNWLDRFFVNTAYKINRRHNMLVETKAETRRIQSDSAIHFTLYNAKNGHILETNQEMHNNGYIRTERELHIISSEQDIGEALQNIIMMTKLRS